MLSGCQVLTNACGEWLDGAGELCEGISDQQIANVPFGCGPGFVQWRLAWANEEAAVQASVDVPFHHPFWGEGPERLPEEAQARSYATAVAAQAAAAVDGWVEAQGATWWQSVGPAEGLEDAPDGALRVGVLVPLAAVQDQEDALAFARTVFGDAVGLAGLPIGE